jgi:hypothetical protein
MSTLQVGTINTGNPAVTVAPGVQFNYAGRVVQMFTNRVDERTTYYSSNTGNGTTIAELALSIKPQYSTSLLWMQWMINHEADHDNVFLIHQNGSLITTAGYEGYNANAGNSRWSGVASTYYDRDYSSTPSNVYLQYAILASSTASRNYAPAVRSSNSNNYVFCLNRPVGSRGASGNEVTVSTGIIMEIQQ